MTVEPFEPTLDADEPVEGDVLQADGQSEDEEVEVADNGPLPVRAANPVAEPPEMIGKLVFVANADYPYPFKVAKPPRFWMEEQTGLLSAAVEAYLDGQRLKPDQLAVIKVYLKQYVERAVLAGAAKVPLLVSKIDKLKSNGDLERFADEVAELGAEVF